jgi:uncharacterized protein YdaU (DUF1376 family)
VRYHGQGGLLFWSYDMAKAPYFPLMVRDWLCSRRVLSMSGDGVKAFMYLLCEAWLQEPRATLPQNENELASMARVTMDVWQRIKTELMQHFDVGKCNEHSGRLYNNTLLEHSRKCEGKQRFNNKNAKRTQNKRKVNAELDIDIDIDSVTNNVCYSDDFTTFWKSYPRRIGKGTAYKAWRKITGVPLQTILDALKWQKESEQWTKDNGQFIPHPTTYLNSRRWEDEPTKPARQKYIFQ